MVSYKLYIFVQEASLVVKHSMSVFFIVLRAHWEVMLIRRYKDRICYLVSLTNAQNQKQLIKRQMKWKKKVFLMNYKQAIDFFCSLSAKIIFPLTL